MNDTIFTVKQLEKVIPILINKGLGITTSDLNEIDTLTNFSLNADETTVEFAEQDNEFVYVKFRQAFIIEEDNDYVEWSEYTRYETIQSIQDIRFEIIEYYGFFI